MDHEDIIRKFIDDNISFLFSKKIDLKKLKKKKTEFFVNRYKKKVKTPNNAHLAHEIIQYLVDAGKIKNQKETEVFIEKIPFLREKAIIRDLSHYKKDLIVDSNPDTIDFLDKFTQKIIGDDLNKEIEIKNMKEKAILEIKNTFNNELEYFHSVVDTEISKTPKQLSNEHLNNKNNKKYTDFRPWWAKIGLIRDPFPTPYGLADIDEKYYDKIIVMLPIFRKYSELARNYPEELLNKSILFYGEYGCGKTTLFDYLRPFFLISKIIPLSIMLDAEKSVFQIRTTFFKKLYDSIAKEMLRWKDFDPRICETGNSINDISNLMKGVLDDSDFKGFIVYLDGLHKFDDQANLALDFLKGLQNFFEELIQNNIKISVFIAGSKLWIKQLRENSAYEGSVFLKEKFDSITPVEAFELIKKRLQTFSNPKSKDFQKIISFDDIERLIYIIQRSYSREIPFRTFIEEFLERINNRKSDLNLISINYDLDQEAFEPIYQKFRENQELFNKIKNLQEELGNNEKILYDLADILCIMQSKGAISEKDSEFKENIKLFTILKQYELISINKKKDTNLWGLNRQLRNFCLDIINTFNYSLKYYIHQILLPENKNRESFIDYSKTVTYELTKIARGNPIQKEKLHILQKNIDTPFQKVINYSNEKSNKQSLRNEIIDSSKTVFQLMLTYLYELSGEERSLNNREELFQEFLVSWKDNQTFRKFITQLNFFKGTLNPTNEDKTTFIASFINATVSLIKKIEKWLHYNEILVIGTNQLNNEEKKEFNKIRALYWQHLYKDSLSTLWNYLENKLRNFIYNVLYLLYGNRWKQSLPTKVKRDIKQENERCKKKKLNLNYNMGNELYLSQRTNYRLIIQDKGNWNNIFKFIFTNLSKEDICNYLHKMVLYATPERHNQPVEFFENSRDEILYLIKFSFEIAKKMNEGLFKLLDLQSVKEETTSNKDNYSVMFSLNNFMDEHNLLNINIDKERAGQIVEAIENFSKDETMIDISCQRDIQQRFFSDYREVIAILAIGISENRIILEKIEGTTIKIRSTNKNH